MRPEEIRYHARVDAILERARARSEPPPPVQAADRPEDEELADRSWVR